jgi:arylmalonate decarboxylase
VNERLKELLAASGIETASLACFDLLEFGGPSRKSEADIVALSSDAVAKAPQADGILISCGGLRTLGITKPLEDRHGLPVVSSTPAAFWAAMRLVGESGRVAGCGRLLEQAAAPVH